MDLVRFLRDIFPLRGPAHRVQMTCKEIKYSLTGRRSEYLCELLERSDRHAVLLYRLEHAARVADVTLPDGTVTYAFYWTDRSYTVYHWIGPGGDTLALYVNLADRVVIRDHDVEWRDLAVDLLFTPDGRVQVLDEDEVAGAPETLQRRIAAIQVDVRRNQAAITAEVASATARLRGAG